MKTRTTLGPLLLAAGFVTGCGDPAVVETPADNDNDPTQVDEDPVSVATEPPADATPVEEPEVPDATSQTTETSQTTGDVAEETTFLVEISNISATHDFAASGVFHTPVGADEPGPLTPGGVYEATFYGAPGMNLNFASMFVPSNDFFFAPGGEGIALFDADGAPTSGDITGSIKLWDAGTEADEEPGAGQFQPLHQTEAGEGDADADDTVRLAADTFSNLPAVADILLVELSADANNMFTLRVENVSTESTLVHSNGTMGVPITPGAWVVHGGTNPFFEEGVADGGVGLENLAEDGNFGPLSEDSAARSGLNSPIAPGVFAVHMDGSPLFVDGEADMGKGLEALAEDGNPVSLAVDLAAAEYNSGAFATPTGADEPGAVLSGGSYQFTITAAPGDRLSFATMLVQSNDLFFGTSDEGIELFDEGTMIDGDITSMVYLWDAGTEVNQSPGSGPNQPPRQAGPDTGEDEAGMIRMVDDAFTYPEVADFLRVTITAQ